MRLIDADALKKALEEDMNYGGVKIDEFDKGYDLGVKTAIEMLDNASTVERQYFPPCEDCHKKMDDIRRAYDKAMARPTGKWLCSEKWTTCRCSICQEFAEGKYKYCPECGADMRPIDNQNNVV